MGPAALVHAAWVSGDGLRAGSVGPLPVTDGMDRTLHKARDSERPVVVMYGAVRCPLCRTMQREAFRCPAVLELACRFVWVRIDIDRDLSQAKSDGVGAVP